MIWWALVVLWGTTARGQEYTAPVIVDLVTATYPAEALEQRREAVVEVWVELDAAGAVLNVTVPEPAGYGFDEAAMAAARSSTFAPGQQGKDAVAMTFVVSFVFELPSASGSQIVTGVVHHRGTVRTLEGVMIELITEGVRFRTETAGDGSFRFEGLPAGPAEVRVTHPGFQPEQARLVLVEGQSSTLTFRLLRTSRGETVAMGTYAAEDVAIEHRLSGEVVRVVPGAFGDPVRVVETLPAVAVSPIVDGQPVVRGAEGTHTRVTVDGIDVPFVFHWFLGRSIVNPSLLEEVRFVPGGLPAAIGQSSQALLDARMATRQDGEGLHGRVSVDIMDSSLALWGSRNQWDLSVGGRVAWLGALTTLVTSPSPSSIQPNYFDYSFGASNTIGHHKIRFDLFGAGDSLSWSAWALSNTPDESLPYNEALIFSRAFHRGAATWNTYGNWGEQRTFFAAGYEGEHNPSGVFLLSPLQEGVRRGRLQGAALQFGNETSLIVGERAEIAVGLHGDYRNFLDRRYINLVQIEDGRFSVGWLSPYGEWQQDVGGVRLTAGGRATAHLLPSGRSFAGEPRLTIQAPVAGDVDLLVYGGGYSQRPAIWRLSEAAVGNPDLPPNYTWGGGVGLKMYSMSAGFTMDVNLYAAYSPTMAIRAQTETLEVLVPQLPLAFQDVIPDYRTGRGAAIGGDLMVRLDPRERWFGWSAVTMNRTWRWLDEGAAFRSDRDQPFGLTLAGGARFGEGWRATGRLRVATGQPFTPISPIYNATDDVWSGILGAPNSDRLPWFTQLDLRIEKTWIRPRSERILYLDLFNATNARTPLSVEFSADFTERLTRRYVPIIPNLGLEVTF